MVEIEQNIDGLSVYEISYLILSSIPEAKVSGVVDKIKKVIIDGGGKELDGERPFKQKLAYKMSKTVGSSKYVAEDAYLGWTKFEAEADKIPGIKAGVESIDEVLRTLLIKAPRTTAFTFTEARKAVEDEETAKKMEEEKGAGEEIISDSSAERKEEVK